MRRAIYVLLLPVLLLLFPAICMAQVCTVNKGDTIYGISMLNNVSQFALRYNNNLWTNMIRPGQKLNIPDRYTAQQGDNLETIGNKFGVDVNSIKLINQLKSDIINPGKVLYIPSKSNSITYTGSKVQNNDYNVSRGDARTGKDDFDLLARLITAEADSESYDTQVAVGATVLNRMDSPQFPDSIKGVIYQVNKNGTYQFEPVLNGHISKPASESAKKAARDALNGVDPTNGALYFFESWVPSKFLQSRPVSRVMDSLTFAY